MWKFPNWNRMHFHVEAFIIPCEQINLATVIIPPRREQFVVANNNGNDFLLVCVRNNGKFTWKVLSSKYSWRSLMNIINTYYVLSILADWPPPLATLVRIILNFLITSLLSLLNTQGVRLADWHSHAQRSTTKQPLSNLTHNSLFKCDI